MTPDADFAPDIAIAGGGIVGLTLALALARAGFAVTLCDPVPAETRAAPGFDGRAYALAPGCVRMLGALGVWKDIAQAAEPVRAMEIGDGRAGAPPGPALLRFDGRETGAGPLAVMIEDRFLRPALIAALGREPRARHLAPSRIEAAEGGPGLTVVRLADGTTLAARLVVACDGRESPLAAAAGIGRTGRDYRETGIVGAIAHERPHEGIARQVFLPTGPLALLPLPGNRSSLVWSVRTGAAGALLALGEDAFLDRLRAIVGGRLGALALAGRRWHYPLALSLALRWTAPRLALAGDAAHAIHPLAGQGLNLGLRDIAALVEVLALAARRGEDIGAPDVLARYERWRRPEAVATALACDGLDTLFSNDMPFVGPLRDAGMAFAGRIGPLRRAFVRAAAASPDDAPALLRGEPV